MGKQAKKKIKSDTQAANQKRHNRATRGMNTRKRGAIWAKRRFKAKDEEGNEVERTYNVTVPANTFWDPWDPNKNDPRKAQEPYDALHLDWPQEMMHFAADNNARIGRIAGDNGVFIYRVYQGDNVDKPDKVFFEVQSARKFLNVRGKRKKKPKKVG